MSNHGTACIIVRKKSKRDNTTLFIDASAGFLRSSNKIRPAEANQHKVLDAFTARKDAAYLAKLEEDADLATKGYSIAMSSYVDQDDIREAVGIRRLNVQTKAILARQAALRTWSDPIVADL